MNTANTQVFKDRLLGERQQLLQRIAAQRGGAVSRVDMAAEHDMRAMESHARAITEMGEEFAMNEHETAELAAIDAALERLAQGQYGLCLDCGVTIPAARLNAYPMALRCVACQTATEKSH
jgi:DnaK suppressor protein